MVVFPDAFPLQPRLSGAGRRFAVSPESKPFPLLWPVGNTILEQEVSGRTVGHVTAAAAERHVGTRGGEVGQLHTQKYFYILVNE